MTGLSKAVLSEWMVALEDGGWLVRDKSGTGRGARTAYSLRKGEDRIERRSRDERTPRKRSPSELIPNTESVRPANPSEDQEAFAQRTLKGSPSERFSGEKGSPSEPPPITTSLPTGESVTKNHQAAVAVAEPPTASAATGWSVVNQQPRTGGARIPRQPQPAPALFAKPKRLSVDAMTEAHRTIYVWLQANGYETLGIDDVRKIHLQLVAAHGAKLNPGYLRAVVSNGGAAGYAAETRKARHEKVAELVRDLQATMPQCAHGTPAGDQPHPTTGHLLCAQCRRGLAAVDQPDATDPVVQSVLDAYRRARGNDILVGELLGVTQQIEAFVANGANPEQLFAIAELAGAERISLIQAAGAAA